MEYNLTMFVWVSICFVALFVVIPWLTMGFRLEEDKILLRIFQSLAAGMAVVVTLVYVLGFLHLLNGWLMWLLILAGIVCFRWLCWRKKRMPTQEDSFFIFFLEAFERFEFADFAKQQGARIKQGVLLLWQLFKKQPVYYCAVLAALAYGAYLRIEPNIAQSFFKDAEVYTHVIWTRGMMDGTMFYDGIYPMGVHCCIAALSLLFGIDAAVVGAYFGSIVGCFLLLGLWLFAAQVFRSKPAVVLALLLYCMADIFWSFPTARQAAALPQEMGMMLIFPVIILLSAELKHQTRRDWFCFLAGIAVVVYTHIGGAVALGLVLLVFFAVHAYYMYQTGLLRRVLLGICIGVAVGGWPMLAGLVGGNGWNTAMERAGAMLTTINLDAPKDAQSQRQYYQQNLTETDLYTFSQMSYEEMEPLVINNDLPLAERLSYANLKKVRHYYYSLIFSHRRLVDFYAIALGLLGIFSIYRVIEGVRKEKPLFQRLNLLALAICAGVFTLLIGAGYLGIPQLLELEQLMLLAGIFGVLIVGGVFELLVWIFFRDGGTEVFGEISFVCAVVLFAGLLQMDMVKRPNTFPVLQYDEEIAAYRKINREYKRGAWTVIAPRNTLAFVKNGQYHFELSDFVLAQANREQQPELTIAADNIFLFVETDPLGGEAAKGYEAAKNNQGASYNIGYFTLLDAKEELAPFGLDYDGIYANPELRTMLEAKAQGWAEDYILRNPENITIYSKGEHLTVYRIKQQKESPGNLILE